MQWLSRPLPAQTADGPSRHVLHLRLPGYLPSLRNALKGAHWSVESREKKRALAALSCALRFTALGPGMPTGTVSSSSSTDSFGPISCRTIPMELSSESNVSLGAYTRRKTKAP